MPEYTFRYVGGAVSDLSDSRDSGLRVWGVADLVQAISEVLRDGFGAVTVRGELSGVTRAVSGHLYFTLKAPDGSAALRCAMFRRAVNLLDFQPANGQEVELRGRLGLYEPRGELQMVVEGMRQAGAGALMEQFLRLKAKLEAEGLFDASRKRPLPKYPRRLAVVTSAAAAAWRDVMAAMARRSPHVELWLVPSPVQGADAPPALVKALQEAQGLDVDAVVLCRGGGSLEDLWAFNDERVVRAVAASRLPVICGVGHETDFTLADFAADLRAPTPTAAAELAAPMQADLRAELKSHQDDLARALRDRLDREAQRLDRLGLRLARPGQSVRSHAQRLALWAHRLQAAVPQHLQRERQRCDTLAARLRQSVHRQLERARQHLSVQAAHLAAADPDQALRRGYARLSDAQGHALTSIGQVRVRQTVHAHLADGVLALKVSARSATPEGGDQPDLLSS